MRTRTDASSEAGEGSFKAISPDTRHRRQASRSTSGGHLRGAPCRTCGSLQRETSAAWGSLRPSRRSTGTARPCASSTRRQRRGGRPGGTRSPEVGSISRACGKATTSCRWGFARAGRSVGRSPRSARSPLSGKVTSSSRTGGPGAWARWRAPRHWSNQCLVDSFAVVVVSHLRGPPEKRAEPHGGLA